MDVSSIVQDLGGRTAVAEATGCEPNSVLYWERRGRVPVRHWPTLIRLADKKKVKGVTAEAMSLLWSQGASAQETSHAP